MSAADPVIASVELGVLETRYPRTVGRNARLGSHGAGPDSLVAILRTDDGRAGWGLVEAPEHEVLAAGLPDRVVGRPLSESIGDDGIREPGLHLLDAPLHDLLGVVEEMPVAALLGGAALDADGTAEVGVYDGAIYFDDLDPAESARPGDTTGGIDDVLAECRADLALGFRDVKLKLGRGSLWMDREAGDARDLAVVRAVRDALPEARILVDANDGYTPDGFAAFVDAAAELGIYWIEEPFGDDGDALRELRRHLDAVSPSTLIADGEFDPDVDALLPIAASGGIDVLLMDVMGYGITAWRRIMPAVVAATTQASPHAWGRPLKTVYAAHLAAGLGNVPIVEGVPGRTAGVDPELVAVRDGRLRIGERPGFGLPVPDASVLRPLADPIDPVG